MEDIWFYRAISFRIHKSMFNNYAFLERFILFKLNKHIPVKYHKYLTINLFDEDGDNIIRNMVTIRLEFKELI